MLTGLFCEIRLNNGDLTHIPVVRASVNFGGHSSNEVEGLIDTGSSINLISMSSVKTLLGISKDEARRGRQLTISGLGGIPSRSYGFQVNLNLRATTVSTNYLNWPNVWLYVCEAPLPYQLLIGQSHGIEEKILVHLNRQQKRYWQIKN
jgi:hypothetical protein